MKGRESGMPEEEYWNSFFDADCLTGRLLSGLTGDGSVVEFGSGYGTFLMSAARRTFGAVYGFEIEHELAVLVNERCASAGIVNASVTQRDFMERGTGLPAQSVHHAMVYNILHIEEPCRLLAEAFRVLKPGATISIIHWRSDTLTPRGPSMHIRPLVSQCIEWCETVGFRHPEIIDVAECCPYHYAVVLRRPG
jgi:ubiquinone/menaquinone biosynthesis C-methylase UbiE